MWKNIKIPDQVIEQNIPHFRQAEQKIATSGKTFAPAWNWAACLFNIYWLLYRRCYKWAAIVYGGMIIASGVLTGITGGFLGPFMPLLIYIVSGLFGNSLYFYGIKEKIFNLQAKGLSDIEIIDKTKPSWKPVIIVLGIVIGIAIITSILMFILGAALFTGLGGFSGSVQY